MGSTYLTLPLQNSSPPTFPQTPQSLSHLLQTYLLCMYTAHILTSARVPHRISQDSWVKIAEIQTQGTYCTVSSFLLSHLKSFASLFALGVKNTSGKWMNGCICLYQIKRSCFFSFHYSAHYTCNSVSRCRLLLQYQCNWKINKYVVAHPRPERLLSKI